VESRAVNGQPGAIFRARDGRILNTWTIDVIDGRVQAIRTVINPDKLEHLGPVADAWAVNRAAIAHRNGSGGGTPPGRTG
jgi:RNA polymerase sigma-70 factor (ECF subfamily)